MQTISDSELVDLVKEHKLYFSPGTQEGNNGRPYRESLGVCQHTCGEGVVLNRLGGVIFYHATGFIDDSLDPSIPKLVRDRIISGIQLPMGAYLDELDVLFEAEREWQKEESEDPNAPTLNPNGRPEMLFVDRREFHSGITIKGYYVEGKHGKRIVVTEPRDFAHKWPTVGTYVFQEISED